MAILPTQQNRAMAVKTPLPDDTLILRAMSGREALSEPYVYELDLFATSADVDVDKLLGHNVTVRVELSGGGTRWFNGFVSELVQTAWNDGMPGYRATLRPWLWFLTRTADCRIFQNLSVPDIVRQVFDQHGFSDVKQQLSGSYAPREYCVQYRESDFAFVNRLLEAEGIYYFFRHENGRHELVLGDAYGAHKSVADYEKIPYFEPGNAQRRKQEHFDDWSASHAVRTASIAVNAFDYLKPRAALLARSKAADLKHGIATLGVYDYPGPHVDSSGGERETRLRLEAVQTGRRFLHFSGNVRGPGCGDLFTLTDCPVQALNAEYLIASAQYALSTGSYRAGGQGGELSWAVSYGALLASEPCRPERRTPLPRIPGPQTATVVGKQGEEIWTDEHGRVKVRFHWDREGAGDENSSCWLRVAQIWAGKQWGGLFIPRIGQEVMVEFLEGDPDRPIVTGRVYNGDHRTPWALPDNATQSGLRTSSSKGGGGANELRFEDRAGEEEIWLHAQKDLRLRVENDRVERVVRDRHLLVERDRFTRVVRDEHVEVKGDRMAKVTGTESLTVQQDIHAKASANQAYEAGQAIHLKGGTTVVIEAGTSITLKAGGASVVIGPSGVFVNGTPVALNSGGSAGSGPGCSPDAPKPPLEVEEAEHGGISPEVATLQLQQAKTLLDAAKFATLLCERCGQ